MSGEMQEGKLLRACREYISLCEKGEALKVNLDEFKAGISELERDAAIYQMAEVAARKLSTVTPSEEAQLADNKYSTIDMCAAYNAGMNNIALNEEGKFAMEWLNEHKNKSHTIK